MERIDIRANGRRFEVLAAGPSDGPLVVFLHGFPELNLTWRHQLEALAEIGYRAVAPNQRGYGKSDRFGPYDPFALSDDVAAIIRKLGYECAVVVGHDWGGGVAWTVAMRHPEVVSKLIVMNCPPMAVHAMDLIRNPGQLRKSSYMLYFQIPRIPERALSKNSAEKVVTSLIAGSRIRSAWEPVEIEATKVAFGTPGGLSGPLGWYRALFRNPRQLRALAKLKVTAPTLVIWGMQDRFLGSELVAPDKLERVMAPGRVAEFVPLPESGHFVQVEVSDQVNAELVRWLGPANAN